MYQILATYLQQLINTNIQIKSLVYSKNFKLNVPSSYSLLSTCVNNLSLLLEFKSKIEMVENIEITNQYLFCVMTSQLVNTGNIKGGGKLKRVIIKNQHLLTGIQKKDRINKGHIQIRVRNGEEVELLSKFEKDQDIPDLYDLKYEEYSELISQNSNFLKNKNLVIQSKSSCIPAFLLFEGLIGQMEKYGNFNVIDCCAAPGNKTIQLAEYLGDHGQIIAFQKDQKRYNVLKNRVEYYQVNNISINCADFLKTSPSDYQNIKFILADPSCSGSGMLVNIIKDGGLTQFNDFEKYCQQKIANLSPNQIERIKNLKAFQLSILDHCSKYKPIRLVYSTCSIYRQQNEQVVQEFLKTHPEYRIKKIKNKGFTRGFGEIGAKCIRMSPLQKKTDGFFVCLFRRIHQS